MRLLKSFSTWAQPSIPRSRLGRLALIAFIFTPIDLLFANKWISLHGEVPSDLYRPVFIARLLHLPTPTQIWVDIAQFTTVVAALASLILMFAPDKLNWLFRVTRAILPIGYLWWMFIAMSYGKVDHDRVGFIVLLAVVAVPRTLSITDTTPDTQCGWLIRNVQIAVVATYFLAAVAKVRFGGWGWLNGATLSRAVIRRGTMWSNWLVNQPAILRVSQWVILWGELLTPTMFLVRKNRSLVIMVFCFFGFHLMTFMALRIVFLPHCIALCAFLPLEALNLKRPQLMFRWSVAPGRSL